jgi:hypothetical protein
VRSGKNPSRPSKSHILAVISGGMVSMVSIDSLESYGSEKGWMLLIQTPIKTKHDRRAAGGERSKNTPYSSFALF